MLCHFLREVLLINFQILQTETSKISKLNFEARKHLNFTKKKLFKILPLFFHYYLCLFFFSIFFPSKLLFCGVRWLNLFRYLCIGHNRHSQLILNWQLNCSDVEWLFRQSLLSNLVVVNSTKRLHWASRHRVLIVKEW